MILPQFPGWRPLELDETILPGDRNVLTDAGQIAKYKRQNPYDWKKWIAPYHGIDPSGFKIGDLQKHNTDMAGVSCWRYYRRIGKEEAAPALSASSTKGRAYLKFGLHPIFSKPLPLP